MTILFSIRHSILQSVHLYSVSTPWQFVKSGDHLQEIWAGNWTAPLHTSLSDYGRICVTPQGPGKETNCETVPLSNGKCGRGVESMEVAEKSMTLGPMGILYSTHTIKTIWHLCTFLYNQFAYWLNNLNMSVRLLICMDLLVSWLIRVTLKYWQVIQKRLSLKLYVNLAKIIYFSKTTIHMSNIFGCLHLVSENFMDH